MYVLSRPTLCCAFTLASALCLCTLPPHCASICTHICALYHSQRTALTNGLSGEPQPQRDRCAPAKAPVLCNATCRLLRSPPITMRGGRSAQTCNTSKTQRTKSDVTEVQARSLVPQFQVPHRVKSGGGEEGEEGEKRRTRCHYRFHRAHSLAGRSLAATAASPPRSGALAGGARETSGRVGWSVFSPKTPTVAIV